MGPLIDLIFVGAVLFPYGFIIGLLLSLVGIPALHRIRNTPKDKRCMGVRRRLRISAAFASVFVVVVLGDALFRMYKDQDDYWRYEGAFDFYRMPLEEPYELVMIDSLDKASIGRWQESESLIWGIIRYERRANFLIGETTDESFPDRNSRPTGWFIFDLTSGHLYKYRSLSELREEAPSHGIQPPFAFTSIKDNWDHYWANPHRSKK